VGWIFCIWIVSIGYSLKCVFLEGRWFSWPAERLLHFQVLCFSEFINYFKVCTFLIFPLVRLLLHVSTLHFMASPEQASSAKQILSVARYEMAPWRTPFSLHSITLNSYTSKLRYFIWVTGKSGSSTSGSSTVDISKLEMQLCRAQIIFKIVAAVLRIRECMTDLINVAVLPE
jgi:hypothetical protein